MGVEKGVGHYHHWVLRVKTLEVTLRPGVKGSRDCIVGGSSGFFSRCGDDTHDQN